MSTKLEPIKAPKGVRTVQAEDPDARLLAVERIVWYDTAPCPHPHEKLFGKEFRCGDQHIIQSGTIFRSMAEIKARGLDQESITRLVKRGSLVFRSMESFIRGGKHFGRNQTPIVLGNTTGSNEGDARVGEVQQNRPDVKFGYHPSNLRGHDLDALQTMIVEVDPSVTPPDSVQGCIDVLSQNHSTR